MNKGNLTILIRTKILRALRGINFFVSCIPALSVEWKVFMKILATNRKRGFQGMSQEDFIFAKIILHEKL